MEHRSEARVDFNVRFFVAIHKSWNAPEMVGVSLECEAVDFSAHGMHFVTNIELSPATLVDITIGVGEPFAMYLLRAEIRWVREANDTFHVGVLLLDEEDRDLTRWQDNFEQLVAGGGTGTNE